MDKETRLGLFWFAVCISIVSILLYNIYDTDSSCLIQNSTQFSNVAYNVCLQGCFNAVENLSGGFNMLNKTNKSQENVFVGCGNTCIKQFENFSEVKQ